MPELVTVKKRRMHPGLVIAAVVLSIGMYIIARRVSIDFVRERAINGDNLSVAGNIGYILLCFILYMAGFLLIEVASTGLLYMIFDRENYVQVRKSSLENPKAIALYEEFRKKKKKAYILNNLITVSLLSALLILFIMKGGSRSQFVLVIWLVCLVSIFNPVDRKLKKEMQEKRNNILWEDCEPAISFDLYEIFRLEPELHMVRNNTLFQQAICCFYLGDYPGMHYKLSMIRGKLMPKIEAACILLRGYAALDTGDQAGFQRSSEDLRVLETTGRNLAVTLQHYGKIREEWQARIDLMSPQPEKALPFVQKELREIKHNTEWMDCTFMLAWIELSRGEKDRARENLRLVAERAGSMAIQGKAVQMLKDL